MSLDIYGAPAGSINIPASSASC